MPFWDEIDFEEAAGAIAAPFTLGIPQAYGWVTDADAHDGEGGNITSSQWLAMSPEEREAYAAQQSGAGAAAVGGTAVPTGSTEQLLWQLRNDALGVRDENQAAVAGAYDASLGTQLAYSDAAAAADAEQRAMRDALNSWALGSDTGHYQNQANATQTATNLDFNTYGQMAGLTSLTGQREGDALNMLYGAGAEANNQDYASLDRLNSSGIAASFGDQYALQGLTGAADQYNQLDSGAIDYLTRLNNSLPTIQPGTYGPDLQSQAATATTDTYSLGQQQTAMGGYNNFAGGSANLGSLAADATANAGDIDNQNRVFSELLGQAGGSSLTSAAEGVRTDQDAVTQQNVAANELMANARGRGNVTSQAAQVGTDPFALSLQNRAVGDYRRNADGSLDITSQAALAAPDEQALAMQRAGATSYGNIAGGALDLDSQAALSQADPGSIEGQRFTQQQYRDRSGVEMTSQERFMMELARREEEQDRRAAMQAALYDLQARGMGGSGAEIGALLGSQQMTSQNRMLQDMAAQANAVARSERMLGAHGAISGQMRDQSFGEDAARGQFADAMALQNRNTKLGALDDYTGLANQMRGQSFFEDYQTGSAADQAAEGNRAARMESQDRYAALGSQMRDQAFGEQFDAARAGDAVALANRDAQNAQLAQYTQLVTAMRSQGYDEQMARALAIDQMSRYNQDFGQSALANAGQLATAMRGQGFEEDYRTGSAQDAMADANRQFQMAALGGQADLSTGMRTQSFGEDYQAGTAADVMAQFNREQSTLQQRWADQFMAQQQNDQFARGADVAGMTLDANQQQYSREGDVYGAQRDVTGDQYAREQAYYDAARGTTADAYGRYDNTYDAQSAANQAEWDRGAALAQQGYDVTSDAYNRALQLSGTGYALTDQTYQRGTDTIEQLQEDSADKYARWRDQNSDLWGATELYTGGTRSDSGAVQNSTEAGIGYNEARRAEEMADEDKSLFDRIFGDIL